MSPHEQARTSFWTRAALLLLVTTAGCANALDVSDPTPTPGDASPEAKLDTGVPEVAVQDTAAEKPGDAPAEAPSDAPADAQDASSDVADPDAADAGSDVAADVPAEADAPDAAEPDAADSAEAGCSSNQKECNGGCVAKDDPAYGCIDTTCEPCAVDHATAVCAAGCAVGTCSTGFGDCDNDPLNGCETDTAANVQQCGSCNHVCAFAHADASCQAGICTLGACTAGFADCDTQAANGCEADLLNDPNQCGSCANVCVVQGGSPVCNAGVCGSSGCNPGLGDCDPNIDGCETNIASSASHCGYCGNACNLPNATPQCVSSQCSILSCASSHADCDSTAANGCEINTQTDPDNCGACGTWCAGYNVIPTCANGQCQMVCTAGFGDCNNDPADGCETALNTAYSCGACGAKCAPANAIGLCTGGICGIQFCVSGFGDCNSNPSDGCEVNVFADPMNCGTCSTVCSSNHGLAGCTGVCTIACESGYGNCNGLAVDGCEAALLDDPLHCGGCTTVCPTRPNSTPSCTGTTCGIVCNAGWADCDANPDNGCEVNLATDPLHCGTCSTVCADPPNGIATCALSACSVTCLAGFGNCDGNAANGCEADLSTDQQHCGSCTVSCGTSLCSAGACNSSCVAPNADCDGNSANGCEVNLQTDAQHCGTCTTQCSANQICTAGQCVNASHVNCMGAGCTNTLAGQNLGQPYTNASPPGTPGNASTYTQQMAIDAATAWPVAGTLGAGTCGTSSVIVKETSKSCAVWTWSGANAGHVLYNSVKTTGQYCLCSTGATTWR